MSDNKTNPTIEDNFKTLNEIIEKMDNSEVSLEESFNLYKEGLELVKDCNERIEKVEKEIAILEKTGE